MRKAINGEQKKGGGGGERRENGFSEAFDAPDLVPDSTVPAPASERPHFINLEDATDPAQMEIRMQARELSTEEGVSHVSDGGVPGFAKPSGVSCGGGGIGRKGSAHFGRSNRSWGRLRFSRALAACDIAWGGYLSGGYLRAGSSGREVGCGGCWRAEACWRGRGEVAGSGVVLPEGWAPGEVQGSGCPLGLGFTGEVSIWIPGSRTGICFLGLLGRYLGSRGDGFPLAGAGPRGAGESAEDDGELGVSGSPAARLSRGKWGGELGEPPDGVATRVARGAIFVRPGCVLRRGSFHDALSRIIPKKGGCECQPFGPFGPEDTLGNSVTSYQH